MGCKNNSAMTDVASGLLGLILQGKVWHRIEKESSLELVAMRTMLLALRDETNESQLWRR
jgi:hypothetical protein